MADANMTATDSADAPSLGVTVIHENKATRASAAVAGREASANVNLPVPSSAAPLAARTQIKSLARDEDDLTVTTTNGKVVRLHGYFAATAPATANDHQGNPPQTATNSGDPALQNRDGPWLTDLISLNNGVTNGVSNGAIDLSTGAAIRSAFSFVADWADPTLNDPAAGLAALRAAVAPDEGNHGNGHNGDHNIVFGRARQHAPATGEPLQISLNGGQTWAPATAASAANASNINARAAANPGAKAAHNVTARLLDATGKPQFTKVAPPVVKATPPASTVAIHRSSPGAGIASTPLSAGAPMPGTAIGITPIRGNHGTSSEGLPVRQAAPIYSGTLSAPLLPGDKVQINLGDGSNWHDAQVNGATWALHNRVGSAPLKNGASTIKIRIVDADGDAVAEDNDPIHSSPRKP